MTTLREKIEKREIEDAIQRVIDGDDLDQGRVSQMEFLAAGAVKIDWEDLDALLLDSDRCYWIRQHVADQLGTLVRGWLATQRGVSWLNARVEALLEEEGEINE